MFDTINSIRTWKQGYFVDQRQYARMRPEEKEKANYQESFLVRPSPLENPICRCYEPEGAIWVTSRLNLVPQLEDEVILLTARVKKLEQCLRDISQANMGGPYVPSAVLKVWASQVLNSEET